MKTSSEEPINPKTYRFHPKRSKGVRLNASVHPTTLKRIHKFACSEGISMGKAIDRLLDTEEAHRMTPNSPRKMIDIAKTTSKNAVFKLFRPR